MADLREIMTSVGWRVLDFDKPMRVTYEFSPDETGHRHIVTVEGDKIVQVSRRCHPLDP